ncbi:hypothetical protein RHMOL_Rhmol05G0172900 [Rhododendron molle]|uniref:Uncharacterized protein n=1 Tax=Rhododendron molle TaxID=49168 RepID=A0ACC0NPW7_RHOML|nr:hypothetical protein RHMOL_Rhmol05G0172900 [Rhododendron molle]
MAQTKWKFPRIPSGIVFQFHFQFQFQNSFNSESRSADSGSKSKRSFNSITPNRSGNASSNSDSRKMQKKTTQKTLGLARGSNSRSASRSSFHNSPFSDFVRGKGKKAAECLRTALREYKLKFGTILNDPDLASFRALPEFKELQEEGGDDAPDLLATAENAAINVGGKLLDEHKSVLDSKKHEFEMKMEQKRTACDEDLKNRAVEVDSKEEKVVNGRVVGLYNLLLFPSTQHWSYMAMKNQKLQEQFEAEATSSSNSGSRAGSLFFKGFLFLLMNLQFPQARFAMLFGQDSRVWTGKGRHCSITKMARSSADDIEKTIPLLLADKQVVVLPWIALGKRWMIYLNELPIKSLPGIGLEEKLKRKQIQTGGQLRMISKVF